MLAPYDARLAAFVRSVIRDAKRAATLVGIGSAACACTSSGDAGNANGAASDGGKGGVDATIATGTDGGGTDATTEEPSDACSGALEITDGPNDGSGCEYYQRSACGLPEELRDHDGSLSGCLVYLGICYSWCAKYGEAVAQCSIVECDDAGNIADGAVTIDCVSNTPQCAGTVGRRPRGLRAVAMDGAGDASGAWLAECARLEAASVRAFRDLGGELEALRAPRALVSRAEDSARDEVRHARVVSRLARARGAKVARPFVARKRAPGSAARDARLLALARDNAIEGCVRETFGALVATWQATHAGDASVARAMTAIARDETRHAALAWAIAAWVDGELSARARAEVRRATRSALDALRCEVARADPSVAAEMGVPAGAVAARMLDGLAELALGAATRPRAPGSRAAAS